MYLHLIQKIYHLIIQMFMEMMQNDKAASDFITAVIPADLAATAKQAQISAPQN